jgi:hypothetical protein
MQQSDWDELKEQMGRPWGAMRLKVDGFDVDLVQVTHPTKKSWSTGVYVDGFVKGIWLDCDHKTGEPKHEETRRFLRKITRPLHTKKDIEFYRELRGKREATRLAAIKFYSYDWFWTSYGSLKKHLEANNTSIERVSDTLH